MPVQDPAVQKCVTAFHHAASAEREKGSCEHDCRAKGIEAYCNAMPTLGTYDSIRDFVSCVTHALLFNLIFEKHATKLLYAAQVALGVLRAAPKPSQSAEVTARPVQAA